MTKQNESSANEVHVKQEATPSLERTLAGRFYSPRTDIQETDDALIMTLDMPGVSRERVQIRLEKDTLSIEGYIDAEAYRGMRPVYSEYPLGHYSRHFALSSEIDQSGISAAMKDGTLTLTLPKIKPAKPRRIVVA